MPAPTTGRTIAALAGWVAASLAAGAIGGIASANAPSFYVELVQPAWAPPPSVFGPVWTTLYILMGVAAWLVWRERPLDDGEVRVRRVALRLFVAQLVLNTAWTPLFFVWRLGAWAFAEIVVLAVAIVATMVAFARIRPLAAWLLAPYLLWVTFAAALTWTLWRANPDLL